MRRDFALSEPLFVCGVETRLPPALRISASRRIAVLTVDEVEDRVDTVPVSRAQCADHLDGFGVLDFFGTSRICR
jgi:hypothetical protein